MLEATDATQSLVAMFENITVTPRKYIGTKLQKYEKISFRAYIFYIYISKEK